jgi:hypothetical protein
MAIFHSHVTLTEAKHLSSWICGSISPMMIISLRCTN